MWMGDLIVTLKIPNSSSTIVCIPVQWNHSDLSGCAPRVGVGWVAAGKQGVQLSKVEEPVDTHWTVTAVGAD